ncbi:sirohydrochlorin chelatase [Agromyces atrinae]|uniref:Sirohydrochlorin chelatase n=1 Tax=Agromyces atrinae TaxID=592376 RepID=A0A4Q2M5L1_9MICO|nr:sirohydrochlorin chelatase [Agromyces atrinae]NYD66568.1 sirohydrochlorin ferrochelatase [Agromyces atrinae]RXZ87239.1 sirohydrochlorin chelatase [Agromyces atrinae]
MTALIACSHGTSDPAGRIAIRSIVEGVRRQRPRLDVREAFVDVEEPEVGGVVAAASSVGDAVVVPLLLSTGFHVRNDIANAVAPFAPGARAARPLGPDPVLAQIIVERLVQAGATPDDSVVFAAAGSSDPSAATDVEATVAHLRRLWSGTITIGYGSMATPNVPTAVEAARSAAPGKRVVIASYLLAPGFFHDRLREAGADLVSAPLAPDPRLADLVIERYRSAPAPRSVRTPAVAASA